MGKTKLTKAEKTALLVVIKKELEVIFEELEVKLSDYEKVSKAIIDNISYILQKGLNTDPEDDNIYKIFDI